MFIKSRIRRRPAGFTLAEALIAFGLSGIIVAGVLVGFIGNGQSLLCLSNYTKLSQDSQNTIDQMTREIRGVSCLTNYTTSVLTGSSLPWFTTVTNSLTFIPVGGYGTNTNAWITYYFNPTSQTLSRIQFGVSQVLLSNCQFLNFQMFQRNQSNGTFIPIPTTSPAQTKLVKVNWITAIINPLMPSQTNTVESAEVVIRSK